MLRYNPPKIGPVLALSREVGEKVFVTPHTLKCEKNLIDYLKVCERKLMKKMRYNFVIRNLPNCAMDVNNDMVNVNYRAVLDTLTQFGKIRKFYMSNGSAYAIFENPTFAQKSINKMQIGKNIVECECVF